MQMHAQDQPQVHGTDTVMDFLHGLPSRSDAACTPVLLGARVHNTFSLQSKTPQRTMRSPLQLHLRACWCPPPSWRFYGGLFGAFAGNR